MPERRAIGTTSASRIRWLSLAGWVFALFAVGALTAYVFVVRGDVPDVAVRIVQHERLTALESRLSLVLSGTASLPYSVEDEEGFLAESRVWATVMTHESDVLEQAIAEYTKEKGGVAAYETFGAEAFRLVSKVRRYIESIDDAIEKGDQRAAQSARYSATETLGSLATLVEEEAWRSRRTFSQDVDGSLDRLVRMQTVSLYLILVVTALAVLYVRMSSRKTREGVRRLTAAVNTLMTSKNPSAGLPERFEGSALARLARSIDDFARSIGQRLEEAGIQAEKLRTAMKATPGLVSEKSESARIAEMRDTEAAMLNLLEDLEKERNLSRDEAARIRTVITSIIDGVIMVGVDGKIRVINPTAFRMFGLGDVKAVGRAYAEILPPFEDMKGEPLSDEEHPVIKSLTTGQIASGQLTISRKDGALPVSYRTAPVISGSELVGVVVVFRDIVDEVELDRAKSEFVSIASHQLKTPLNGIRWYIESILDGDFGELTEELAHAVSDVHESSLHMADLIDTLLNVSRIESGRVRIEPVPVDLADVVEEVLTEVKPAVQEKKIAVSTEFGKDVPAIKLDRNLIKVVVQNFITNAVKYSKDGGPVSITLSKEGEEAKFSVKDSGIGIPLEQQKNIFKKMFRAENVQEQKIEGNGLGLYIAKAVIDSFGGRMWFESVENEGTTFYFTVPLDGVQERKGDRTLIVV